MPRQSKISMQEGMPNVQAANRPVASCTHTSPVAPGLCLLPVLSLTSSASCVEV